MKTAELAALADLANVPRAKEGPVFAAPWQAQAFAMTLALYEKGLFTWSEWASCLAEEIKRAQRAGDPDLGDTYYEHWLAALERIVADKGAAQPLALEKTREAWKKAAERTPHGRPIVLDPKDLA